MWENIDNKLAILELYHTGSLTCRKRQESVHRWLGGLSWTQKTNRRGQLVLVEDARSNVLQLLNNIWPDWQTHHALFLKHQLPISLQGWSTLQDVLRQHSEVNFPQHVNHHTAASILAPHSKAEMTPTRQEGLNGSLLVNDAIIRIRPPQQMTIQRHEHTLNVDQLVSVFGELCLPQRALLDGLVLKGEPSAVMFVENLGAWIDMPHPNGWMLVFVPGWQTTACHYIMDRFAHVPIWHFGDLDPNGYRIVQHLRQYQPSLQWFVPPFWSEYLSSSALKKHWDIDPGSNAPDLVYQLARQSKWLEQEAIVLDPRLGLYMESLTQANSEQIEKD